VESVHESVLLFSPTWLKNHALTLNKYILQNIILVKIPVFCTPSLKGHDNEVDF